MRIKIMVTVLLLFGLTVSLFAYGQYDEGGSKNCQRENFAEKHEEFIELIESKEKISLTGELVLENRILPELKVGNDVYKLMVPPFCLVNLDIEEGTEILLEGVILKVKEDVHTRILNEGEEVFFVTKAIINGEEYSPEKGPKDCGRPDNDENGTGNQRKGHHGSGHHGPGFGGPGFGGPLIDIFE